jgi:hypothetical protein
VVILLGGLQKAAGLRKVAGMRILPVSDPYPHRTVFVLITGKSVDIGTSLRSAAGTSIGTGQAPFQGRDGDRDG